MSETSHGIVIILLKFQQGLIIFQRLIKFNSCCILYRQASTYSRHLNRLCFIHVEKINLMFRNQVLRAYRLLNELGLLSASVYECVSRKGWEYR